MTDKNEPCGEENDLAAIAGQADTLDDAERRELLKRIGRVGAAAVPTAILMSNAAQAQAGSTQGGNVVDNEPTGGGGF